MSRPVVITVAITGSVARKKHSAAVPVTPNEQIMATKEAFDAGASVVHIHVRNRDESSSSDPSLFQQVQEGVRHLCPGMIIQFSTGGRGREASERGSALFLMPDMATLTTGSVNFPKEIYANPPDFVADLAQSMNQFRIKPEIEIFDLSMLYSAKELVEKEILQAPLHCQFVLGVKNALPAKRSVLEFLVSEIREILPGSTWTAVGIGKHQLEVLEWSLELGGHVRTGLEDSLRIDKDRLAKSNAELVQIAAEACTRFDAYPASPEEARKILGLS